MLLLLLSHFSHVRLCVTPYGKIQIAEKRRQVKGKGERERYKHLNSEFQRIARRDKKAFLSNQCKEIEENKTMGCFYGCLMSSASIQKLFCGICSALKCSFDEFVGEKVVSPSYSSAISGPPPPIFLKRALVFPLLLFSSISLH